MRAPASSHSSRRALLKQELDKESGDHYQTSKTKHRCVQDLGPTALAASLQEVTFLHPSQRTPPKVLHTIFCNATNLYIQCPLVALDYLGTSKVKFSSFRSFPSYPLMPLTFLHSPSPPPSCLLAPTLVLFKAARSCMDTSPVWTAKRQSPEGEIHFGTGGRRGMVEVRQLLT